MSFGQKKADSYKRVEAVIIKYIYVYARYLKLIYKKKIIVNDKRISSL